MTRLAQLGVQLTPDVPRSKILHVLETLQFSSAAAVTASTIRVLPSGDLQLYFPSLPDAQAFLRGKHIFLHGTPIGANYHTPSAPSGPPDVPALLARLRDVMADAPASAAVAASSVDPPPPDSPFSAEATVYMDEGAGTGSKRSREDSLTPPLSPIGGSGHALPSGGVEEYKTST